MKNKKIIVIAGPTATGKSDLSIALAKHYKLPVVNADSLLFYQELQIGVAKPSLPERKEVPHYLIDVASISEPLNAKMYRDLAEPLMEELWKNHSAVIVCGGSGFYIRALLYGMYDSLTSSKEVIHKSQELYQQEGIDPFIAILQNADPLTLQKLHFNDHYRLRRAVEHWWMTQTPLSQVHLSKSQENKNFPYWKEQGWEILYLYTDIEKHTHHSIIEQRTMNMLKNGLIEEVQELLKKFSGLEKPLQSIGYKEVQEYLQNSIQSLEELQEKIVISTRQLAKSQRTWFAKVEKVKLQYPHFLLEAQNYIDQFLSYSKM